jgi:hypothetical protein
MRLPEVSTCQGWLDAARLAYASAKTSGLASATRNDYSWPWIFRTHVLTVARNTGVKRMSMPRGFTVKMLGDSFGQTHDLKVLCVYISNT